MITLTKDDKIKISVGSLAAFGSAVLALLTFAEPIVSEELTEKIQEELKPLKNDLNSLKSSTEVIITSSIESYRQTVQALEYKRDMCGNDFSCWTQQNAVDLSNAQRNLRAAEAALRQIRSTDASGN